ncbi:DUF5663 domain-containing protein [Planosporangium sp. 12N6]|uniref:DUF5663 domain-containing protein n=1 Tax=Planosporangium spinosum TaxID=3402278 RepID=UPI003CEE8EDD
MATTTDDPAGPDRSSRIKLDQNTLVELGLAALPPAHGELMLRYIYETLELRVGTTLAAEMSESELADFEGLIDAGDEAGALDWLVAHRPDYKAVVRTEWDRLRTELAGQAAQLIEVSRSHADVARSGPPQSGAVAAEEP